MSLRHYSPRLSVVALACASLVGVAVSSPVQAEEDAVGFSKPYIDVSKFKTLPMNSYMLNTRVAEPSTIVTRPIFGKVQGFPADMPLLLTLSISGPEGASLEFFTINPLTNDGRTADFGWAAIGKREVTLAPGLSTWKGFTETAFTGTQDAINAALSLLIVRTGSGSGKVTVKYVVTRDEGAFYNIANNHFYKFVDWSTFSSPDYVADGVNRTWDKALADAATLTYKGVAGHLATITSESENAFVRDRLGQARNVFLAGSDKDREGQWKWYAGPENGQVFWEARCAADDTCNGEAAYHDRTPSVNTYSSWAVSDTAPDDPNANEPNDWGAGVGNAEDYLVTNRYVQNAATQDPRWNDLPIGGSFIGGYVVEFSGNVEDYSGVYTREVTFDSSPIISRTAVKRTSSTTAEVTGQIYGYAKGSEIEIQRRTGKEKFKAVRKWSSSSTSGFIPIRYSDKLPSGNTLRAYDYRIVIRPTALPEPVISPTVNVPIASRVAQVVADLKFKVGEHIAASTSSLFKGFGLKAGTKFKITLRSDPVVLLNATVGSDGSISSAIDIQTPIESGDHTVTLEGTSRDGKAIKTVASFSLDDDLVVTKVSDSSTPAQIEQADELPATGSSSNFLLVITAVVMSFGGALLAVRRRLVALRS